MSPGRAVVIGGGLGALATALRLSAGGWTVTVCEQGRTFGGKMNRWQQDGFVFDTGPSLITMPDVFRDLFAVAGSRLDDHLDLVEMRPLADYHFADGTHLVYSTALPQWLETLRRLDPHEGEGFWRFLRLGAQLFELSNATFFRTTPRGKPDPGGLRALRHMPLRDGWGNYQRTVDRHFRTPYLRQLYGRYPTYVGSSPYRTPATLAVIPYIEYTFGGWYIRGGLYRLVEQLVRLAERQGVALEPGTRVERIDCQGTRVRGVTLAGGRHLPADVVVMNGDASHAPALLGRPAAAGLPASERSLSGLVFLLGTRRTWPELKHHAVYFSADYEAEFRELFEERRFPADPTVYVNVPSRTDRSVVPASGEGETIFVMANAPAGGDSSWTPERIAEARQRIFARLRRGGLPDLLGDVVVEDVWTPDRLQECYGAPGGAIYGTHSHGWRRAFLRPPNRDAHVRGLYFVGGSTHPGGGTPTVLMSARITTDLIAQSA